MASLVFVVGAAVSVLVACSSSSSSSANSDCSSDPFSCPAGQTCAAKDASGAFACLPSGGGAKGSSCQNTVGVTSCGDGLVCLQLSAAGGQCSSFCDAAGTAHPCASGEQCRAAELQGTSKVFYVCAGGTTPADAGHD
jgi:hypothetical protein